MTVPGSGASWMRHAAAGIGAAPSLGRLRDDAKGPPFQQGRPRISLPGKPAARHARLPEGHEASRWLAAGAIILVGVSVAEIQALNRADDRLRGTSQAKPKDIRTGQERALAGRPAEEAVSQATGVPRNVGHGRQTVHGTGTAGIRIPDLKVFGPDASLSIRGSIIEVKDVTRLSGTRQIRDLAAEAQKLGGRLEIFTRGNTRIPKTGALADLIESGAVVINKIPGT